MGIVSKHIDDVEALGEVGSVNLERIAKAIARDRSLWVFHLYWNDECGVDGMLMSCGIVQDERERQTPIRRRQYHSNALRRNQYASLPLSSLSH